jgi:hypothetical protein
LYLSYPGYGAKAILFWDAENEAIAIYKGAIKQFFVAIATQLDIPTSIESNDDKPPKPMSVDALMEEIAIKR